MSHFFGNPKDRFFGPNLLSCLIDISELQRPGVRPKVGAPALFAGDRQVQVRRDVQDDHEDEIKEMLMELKKLTYK